MKQTKYLLLGLIISTASIGNSFAQSEEDPLDAVDGLIDAIEALESEDGDGAEEDTSTENGSSNQAAEESTVADESTATTADESTTAETPASADETGSSETATTDTASKQSGTDEAERASSRLIPKEAPAGKEDHLLYKIPGAIEYKGMTFLKIDSPKFFNQFQRCDLAENETLTGTLARLKVSQGAPLECRETMKFQFIPYKTFRATR